MATTQVNQMLAAAAAACEDKKADDIRILALDPAESGLTDYFLICSGNSDRQNIAITDEIEMRLKREFGTYPNSVEGRRQGEWILMDYVDFIVHVFSTEKRAFYGLERLRKTATSLTIDELNSEITKAITAGRKAKPVAKKKAAKTPPTKKVVAAKKSPSKSKVAAVASVKKTAVKAKKKVAPAKAKAAKKATGKKR
jgi:ribosome-associated protein